MSKSVKRAGGFLRLQRCGFALTRMERWWLVGRCRLIPHSSGIGLSTQITTRWLAEPQGQRECLDFNIGPRDEARAGVRAEEHRMPSPVYPVLSILREPVVSPVRGRVIRRSRRTENSSEWNTRRVPAISRTIWTSAPLLNPVLQQSGFKVLTAPNGTEGVEAVPTHNLAVVTLGLGLPEIDGFEVIRRLHLFPTPTL